MKTFMVTTQSVFSNKYFITAETEEQAVERVLDNDSSDFYQLHLGERNVITEEVTDVQEQIELIKREGYF